MYRSRVVKVMEMCSMFTVSSRVGVSYRSDQEGGRYSRCVVFRVLGQKMLVLEIV